MVLGTAAAVHHHAGQVAEDDVQRIVKVEHGDGRQFAWGAARHVGVSQGAQGVLGQVCVHVLLVERPGAVARAVVRLVPSRRYDEVPAEGVEVDRQRVAATPLLLAVVLAVLVSRASETVSFVGQDNLQERLLS